MVSKIPDLISLCNSIHPFPQVIFVQEAGLLGQDPPGALSLVLPEFRIFMSSSAGPEVEPSRSSFKASLVTLVAKSLASEVSLVQRAPNGAALLVQLGEVLLVNAYLPSGLDWAGLNSEAAGHAESTYNWIADSLMTRLGGRKDYWVVAGDLNETSHPLHRTSATQVNQPHPAMGRASRRRGFFLNSFLARVDGSDLNNGDHTFSTNGGSSTSLLDRFLAPRVLAGNIIDYRVWPTGFSDHNAVQLVISLPLASKKRPKKWQWTQRKFIIPHLGVDRQRAFHAVNDSFKALEAERGFCAALRDCSTSLQLEEASSAMAEALTTASRRAFRMTQNCRNRKPFHSRACAQLNQLKRNLVNLINQLQWGNLGAVPKLMRSISKGAFTLLPSPPPRPMLPVSPATETWARALLALTRKCIKASYRKHRRVDWDSFVRGPRVSVFAQKIAKKPRPPPVTSVLDPATGTLSDDPDLVKQQLLLRVTEPMSRPPLGPRRLPPGASSPAETPVQGTPDWYREIYTPIDVGAAWVGLCDSPTWLELKAVVGAAKKHTSPGEGALGIDLIQCCIDWNVPFDTTSSGVQPGPIAKALLAYLAAVLRVGVYPKWSCTAWITTIGKGAEDPLDVRPISVLPELYRLVSRILNARLLAVFRSHSILHSAQRAGLTDGDFLQCLDVVTSIIEDARTSRQLVLMLYDQSKAFDLVTPAAIKRACIRLNLPQHFISLVVSAMSRARARVRTVYGLSEAVDLVRSLRQGDPLASIMYCIYIDPLHHLLEKLGGYKFTGSDLKLASSGFMDDTAVAANSFPEAKPLHRAVVEFSLLNDGLLNSKKSLLFLKDHRGVSETRTLSAPSGPIVPVDPASVSASRYLGLWINLDLSWDDMDKRIKRNFWRIFYCIKNNKLPLRAARLTIDLWLIPVLRPALRIGRYAEDPAAIKMLQNLQKALNSLLARNAGCPHPRNWSGPVAAVLFNIKDLIQQAKAFNIESLHLNLNLPAEIFPSAAATKARLQGFLDTRLASRHFRPPSSQPQPSALGSVYDLATEVELLPLSALDRRSTVDCDMATKLSIAMKMNLRFLRNPLHSRSLAFVPSVLSASEFRTLFHHQQGGFHPTIDLLRALHFQTAPVTWDLEAYNEAWLRELVEVPVELKQDVVISVYTDGSAKFSEDAGAVAIFTVGGVKLLTIRTRLRGSRQSFLPECVGCLIAVKFAPLNLPAETICDCRSALFVSVKHNTAISWRKRLTAAARPPLECLRAILPLRSAPLDWRWIRSHADLPTRDADTVFNDEADREAKAARGLTSNTPWTERTWLWGAESSILATSKYPSLSPQRSSSSQPRQVMGSVKGFLHRLRRVSLAKSASKSDTMGWALRYNGEQVLKVVELLSKFASSTTHAVMAMALASYLPLANRSTWTASSNQVDSNCSWCCTGLKQDSPHLFNCPRLSRASWEAFRQQHDALQQVVSKLSLAHRKTLGRVACKVDVIRDCLALQTVGRVADLDQVPLNIDSIRALPQTVLTLASAFARWFVPHSGDLGKVDTDQINVCVAESWTHTISALRRKLVRTAIMKPDTWNSAPLPSMWDALHSAVLPAPFHAVVFDGCPALPPPPSVVWYTSPGARGTAAWWAMQPPAPGARLRLFEWAALASESDVTHRVRWWSEVVEADPFSLVWAVVPAAADLTPLTRNSGLVSLISGAFMLQLAVPQDPHQFWLPARAGLVGVKSVLILNTHITSSRLSRWSVVAPSLPSLLCSSDQIGSSVVGATPAFVPANWWWGPSPWPSPVGAPRSPAPFSLNIPSSCLGDALCLAACSSPLNVTHFSRFMGNLGIPPISFTDVLSKSSPTLLEGDREPPLWVSRPWGTVQSLLRTGKRFD